jgi:hypothetical protein
MSNTNVSGKGCSDVTGEGRGDKGFVTVEVSRKEPGRAQYSSMGYVVRLQLPVANPSPEALATAASQLREEAEQAVDSWIEAKRVGGGNSR